MRVSLERYGINISALVELLRDSERHSHRNLVLNEQLFDVRGWATLEPEEIARRLEDDPLSVLCAWELTEAAEALAAAHQTEAEFLRQFTRPELVERMLLLAVKNPPDPLPDLHRVLASARHSAWDALKFLQDVVRWARRFAHLSPGERREFRRINLQHPFAAVALDTRIDGWERLIYDVMADLGIAIAERDSAAHPDLRKWLLATLGIRVRAASAQQRMLDFREAGGTANSVYAVRAMGGVDGFDVRGVIGEDLGLIIDIGDREVTTSSTAYIEQHVVRVINDRTKLSADIVDGSLRLRWYEPRYTAKDLAQIIHAALKKEFILGVVSVNMIFDPLRIASLKPSVYAYIEDRASKLQRRSEEGEPFVVCTACKSYAPHAFCIASADHEPCCGRSYDELTTLAQLTRGMAQATIKKGVCQHKIKGAWIGVDKAAQLYTEGRIERVNLHSITEQPHPTTAIPQCIAYLMDELDVIGIVSRDFTGRTPDGKTWDTLLARVAGRQVPGFVGVSEGYVLSPKFLSMEGGLARVGWINSALKTRLRLRAEHIATEHDVINIAELKEFSGSWRR